MVYHHLFTPIFFFALIVLYNMLFIPNEMEHLFNENNFVMLLDKLHKRIFLKINKNIPGFLFFIWTHERSSSLLSIYLDFKPVLLPPLPLIKNVRLFGTFLQNICYLLQAKSQYTFIYIDFHAKSR